jgi:hypothetical protein
MPTQCATCGNKLAADAKFCASCGQPVAASSSTVPHTNTPVDSPFSVSKTNYIPNQPSTSATGGPILEERPFWQKSSGVIVILAILGLGVLALTTLGGNKIQNLINQASEKIDSSTANSGSDTPGKSSPGTAVQTDKRPVSDGKTDCYAITLPADAQAQAIDNCSLVISYGTTKLSRLTIQTLIGSKPNLQAHVDVWQKIARKSSTVTIQETKTKVGAYEAHKIVYRFNRSTHNQVLWMVYTGPKYKVNNYNPDGFEIQGDYGTPDEVNAAEAILTSMQWK